MRKLPLSESHIKIFSYIYKDLFTGEAKIEVDSSIPTRQNDHDLSKALAVRQEQTKSKT